MAGGSYSRWHRASDFSIRGYISRYTRFSVIGHVPVLWLIHIDRVGESAYVCVDADDVMRGHRHFHEEHVSMRFAYGNDLDFQCKDRSPPPPRAVTKWFNNEQSDQDSRRPRPMHFTIARPCTRDVDDATGRPDVPDRRPFPSSTLAASSINSKLEIGILGELRINPVFRDRNNCYGIVCIVIKFNWKQNVFRKLFVDIDGLDTILNDSSNLLIQNCYIVMLKGI